MVTIDWYVPNTVLYINAVGRLTTKDLLKGDPKLVHLLENTSSDTIDLLLDFSQLDALPSITTLVKLRWAKHNKLGKVIIIGSREPLTFTASLVGQLFRKDLIFVDALSEAQQNLDVATTVATI